MDRKGRGGDDEDREDPWGVASERWIPVGDDFVECDVIRWVEVVWERKGPKRKTRVRKIGERENVTEVIEEDEDEGWVYLNVLKSRVTARSADVKGQRVRALPEGKIIKRKRRNVVRKGKTVERLPWSDESARKAVIADLVALAKKKGGAENTSAEHLGDGE